MAPDETPLRGLFEQEHQSMLRLAVLLVSSREAAEDIVQDAFAVVDQRWEQIDNPGGYLRTTVVNGCRMHLRRRETEERNRPERRTIALPEQLIEIQDAIDRLDDDQRIAVVLRYLNDLPFRDVAAAMGCPSSTARSHVRRGLRALRDLLEEDSP